MSVPCWGKRPVTGPCKNTATRFYVSLIPKSEGVTPANRAVCASCATSYRFDLAVETGSIREVPEAEWSALL